MEGLVTGLNALAGPWAAGMWTALWQSSILIGAIFLIGAFFRKIPSAVRFWLWMLVGLRLLIMPLVTLEIPLAPLDASHAPQALAAKAMGGAPVMPEVAETGRPAIAGRAYEVGGVGRASMVRAAGPVAPDPAPALSGQSMLFLLWAAGLMLALARLAWVCQRTRRTVAAARYGSGRVDRLAARAGALLGMKRPPRVGITVEPVAPFVYGVVHPAVLLPHHLVAQAEDDHLVVILTHEFAHIKRRDPLLGWAFALCHALYFFHPMLPFVRRQLLLERERACDDWVLSVSKAQPSAYARVLVTAASYCTAPRQAVPALIAGESFGDLKKRLLGLQGNAPRVAGVPPALAIALVAAGLVTAPGIAITQPDVAAKPAGLPAEARVSRDPAPEEAIDKQVRPSVEQDSFQAALAAPADQSPDNAMPETRTLRFPPDRDVGILKVRNSGIERHIDEYWYWNDWEDWNYLGSARGLVRVPAGMDVWLSLNDNAVRDTAFLRDLRPDDIYRISTLYADENGRSLDDAGMEDVVTLKGLRSLELRYSQVSDRGLAMLKELPNLAWLQTPRKLTDQGMAYIGEIATLRGLYINQNNATDRGMAHLKNLIALEEFYAGGGAITDTGLAHLAGLPKLGYVMLWGENFGDAGMLHLAKIPNLKILNVARLDLTNRGVQYLAQSPSLETLSLYGVKDITGLALQHLAQLKTLRKLNLSGPSGEESNLNGFAMSFLAGCRSLEAFDAPRDMDDAGLAHIAKLSNLRVLRLWSNSNEPDITDKGLFSIASMRNLRELYVAGGGFTDSGLMALAGLQELESLLIMTGSEAISDTGVRELSSLGKLEHLDLNFGKRSGITLSAVTGLNVLASLVHLDVKGVHQDDSVLDLSPLQNLEVVSFYVYGGLRDADVASFSGMHKLRWLQGLSGLTDAGVAHVASLTQLDRLHIAGEEVSDASLDALSKMHRLDTLTIEGNFTEEGIRSLHALRGLHWLNLKSETPLSDTAQERLISALPNLTSYNSQALAGGK